MADRGASRFWPGLAGRFVIMLFGYLVGTASAEEVLYTVKPGDTLIGIAKVQLSDPGRWVELKSVNRVPNDRRLKPGSTLRIPVEWMRQVPGRALIVRADGEVTVDGRAPSAGDVVAQGSLIKTGARGSLTMRLADGAQVIVQPGTTVRLEALRTLEVTGAERARLRLDQGRLENAVAPKRKPGALFEVQTPAAVAGVRGTRYRVADVDGAAVTEVLEGSVKVAGASAVAQPVDLKSGFGVRVTAQGAVETPVGLLPAPALGALPALQERPLVRFRLPEVAGAARYRAQVSSDATFQSVLQEAVGPGPDVRFSGLPDGEYVLRVRAVDASGIEGRDATHAFRLKARPEPPFPSAPADKAKIRGQEVQFRWTASAEAAWYVLQVAAGADFKRTVVEAGDLTDLSYAPTHRFDPGKYTWRIASVRKDGDRGPWSDSASFEVFPPPAVPEPPALDDKALTLRWPAEPGQRFLFQMARDPAFSQLHVEQRLDVSTITLPRPGAGSYFVRVQATDPDGFVGPFTSTQRIEVPEPPPSALPLLFLIPFLLLL